MEEVKKDYAFLDEETLIVRVTVLPVGVNIEIENLCDSSLAGQETASRWKLGCRQRTYNSLEAFAARKQEPNLYGEVFYNKNKIARADVNKHIDGYDPKKGGPAVIPAEELINPFKAADEIVIAERFYA